MPKVKVSFVVLNWNGIEDTLNCLDSIRQQTLPDIEIIVVDNGSSENQKNILREIPDIILVDLPRNTGFTGGQIAALEYAKGEFIALINNDAVIAKDWAEIGVATMRKRKKAAAVGGRAYQWDSDKGQKAFDLNVEFYSYQVVNLISGHTRTLSYGDSLCEVNSISGAGVLIRRAAIDDVGYFDNKFFAYYEETDLFARFKRVGWKILYNPEMHVWHQIAKSTKSKPGFYLYYMHRNRFRFAVRNYDYDYLMRFIRYYLFEVFRSIRRVIRHGKKNSTEEIALLKAACWNTAHIFQSLISRYGLGRNIIGYSESLLRDKGESIGVVIPCYNYANHVSEAIESSLNQSLKPDRIIVINDGSSDNSLEVINKYKDKVEIIDQKNQGVIATKNRGLKEIGTDWVIFLDADDKLHKDYIKKLYSAARAYNSQVVYCGMRMVGHENNIFESRPYTLHSLRKGNYINNSALMKRDLLLGIGGYNQEMDFGYEDWELYLSLAEKGAKFLHISSPLLYYRRHEISSRDIAARKKLKHSTELIKQLHPNLFTTSQQIRDIIYTIATFHQRRTLWQVVKDLRYSQVTRLDELSKNSVSLNKGLGFARLLLSGDFKTIGEKTKLNLRRLWQRIV